MPIILNDGIFEDKKQYGITPNNGINLLVLLGVLNSTLTRLIIELSARQLTGAQAIADIDVDVVKNLLIPNIFDSSSSMVAISQVFKVMIFKKSNSIFIECGINPDVPIYSQKPNPILQRMNLDNIIFDFLNLTEQERKEVYWAVCELVQNRLQKARSV